MLKKKKTTKSREKIDYVEMSGTQGQLWRFLDFSFWGEGELSFTLDL